MKFFFVFCFVCVSQCWALPPSLEIGNLLQNPPPRIIRTCCSFGVDVKVAGFPFKKLSNITGTSFIGSHKYFGDKGEGNGIIYCEKGGFIDMGHLRDMADYTAYLFLVLKNCDSPKAFSLKLGNEAGQKILNIHLREALTDVDIANLAAKIAYDISVWHEISTWFGASYIPLVPERYSSFSVEDAFSNLLGTRLAVEAILSNEPYEKAMNQLIKAKLKELYAYTTPDQTIEAMNKVKNIWWNPDAKLPSKFLLKKREFQVYHCVKPLLVDSLCQSEGEKNAICLSELSCAGLSFDQMFTLEIKTNFKIPTAKMGFADRYITQRDFPTLIQEAQTRANKLYVVSENRISEK